MPAPPLPTSVRLQLVAIGPALLGAVCGFLLDLRPAAYWAGSTLAAMAGLLAGAEEPRWRRAAAEGIIRGVCFGAGVAAASASAGLTPRTLAPSPIGLIVPLSAVFGGVLGLAGGAARGWLQRRRAA